MKVIYRLLIIIGALLGALACYSMGMQSGIFLFIILGFLLEGAFWFGLFARKRK